jgi:RecA/RadA recombinase
MTDLDVFGMSKRLDKVEKAIGLRTTELTSIGDPSRFLFSGSLSSSLITGGGWKAGYWYELVGPEKGGKTTSLYSALAQAYYKIPNYLKAILIDAEGVTDDKWFSHIIGIPDLKTNVFGEQNAETGAWNINPRIRRVQPNQGKGEEALRLLQDSLTEMPDKTLINGQWFYIKYPNGAQDKASLAKKLKGIYIDLWFKETGNFYVPVPNNYAGPELVIGIDSLPTLVPEATVDKDSQQRAQQATMYKRANTLKSLISKKSVIVLAINQIRHNPANSFGPSEYYPCGNTISHVTDVRVRYEQIAPKTAIEGKYTKCYKLGTNSVESGKEIVGPSEYIYSKVETKKNIIYVNGKKTLSRWWVSYMGDSGYGIDPVFDTFLYLEMTNQLYKPHKTKPNFKLAIPGFEDHDFTFDSFSDYIRNNLYQEGSCMRSYCINQLANGDGMKMYIQAQVDCLCNT